MGDIKAEGNAAGVPTPNESYLYDPLYRLQEVDDATGTPWQTYTYNGTGDRLTKAMAGLGTDSYNYQTGTHRLLSIGGYDVSNRAVDANGNTTAFQASGWTYGLGYNDTNRLALVQQNGSTVATYGLNGQGERVAKTLAGGGTQVYAYDEAGHLLGEYATGQSRDYVWADGTLVAILDNPAQGGDTIHYVYTDNLGTPRSVTTETDTLVWDWPYNQNPLGEAPASGSGYTFNLRYPGQYYDQEDGLNYNYFRDYEPGTGRYAQPDPLGLGGGISAYAYVRNHPLTTSDLYGLAPDGPQTCAQLGLGADCQSVYGIGEAEKLAQIVHCAERGAEKCIVVCALKNFVGADLGEVSRNVAFEAVKMAAERIAKKKAIEALEHFIPVVGWGKTIYDGVFTWKCSWECAKK